MWIIVLNIKFLVNFVMDEYEIVIWHIFWRQKEHPMMIQDDLYCKSFTVRFDLIILETNDMPNPQN